LRIDMVVSIGYRRESPGLLEEYHRSFSLAMAARYGRVVIACAGAMPEDIQ
jgi:hypothetical protein